MGRQRPLPHEARSAAEFVACLRWLKEQSGLTYRQLEANAERRGDVLARSTAADALRRDSLPRAEVVVAFVRACGGNEDAAVWLEARDRLATAEPSEADGGAAPVDGGSTLGHDGRTPVDGGSTPAHDGQTPMDDSSTHPTDGSTHADDHPAHAVGAPMPGPTPGPTPASTPEHPTGPAAVRPVAGPTEGRVKNRRALAASAVAALLLAAVGAWALLPGETSDRGTGARTAAAGPRLAPSSVPSSTTDVEGPAPGPSRIRPALAPKLCVTEGHDRKGRYRSQVAVQRPCADATPPDLSLVSVGNTGSYYIQWRHPVYGDGCLTALGSGHVVEGLLEPWPWESCSADRTSQHFFFDPVGGSGADAYRIHVVQNGMCLGIDGADDRAAGAEIAQQRCTGARDQEFLVDAVE
ncbi:RICIN domain-containing protein [Streptomyces violarus]|uniref:RICIN domain-containing protein n=1 Tax=Streptomyces violarus TaxID=67380 RepID=UPI0021BECE67|nr:RICIN domain-containing protein [Streptomyces violarus]MCT9139599.1 RICIN domain-containing protein [Streptomyces violarus]